MKRNITRSLTIAAMTVAAMAMETVFAADWKWTGGGTPNADGSYNWEDPLNWGKTAANQYPGNYTSVEIPADVNATIKLTTEHRLNRDFTIGAGANVTLEGCGLVFAGKPKIGANATIVWKNIKNNDGSLSNFESVNIASGANVGFIGCTNIAISGFSAPAGGSLLLRNATATGTSIGGAGANATITLDNASVTLTNGGLGSVGENAFLAITNHSSVVATSGPVPVASGRVRLSDESSMVVSGTFYLETGGTFEVVGKSTLNPTSHFKLGGGIHFIIDDSIVNFSGAGNHLLCSSGDGGDTFTFRGENPKLILAVGFDMNNSSTVTKGAIFEFEVPEKGFVEPPIQNKGSGVLFGNPTKIKPDGVNAKFIHLKVLSSSPALNKDLDFKSIAQLWSTSAGVQKFDFFDCTTEGGETAVWEYTTTGYASVATKASEANELWVTLGENGEISRRGVSQSAGVADNTAIAVAGRAVTLTSAVTLLADAPLTTRCRLYVGTSEAELALAEDKDVNLTATGEFSIEWVAPEFNATYVFKLVLETLKNGVVVASEESPVKSGITTDTAAYTWQAVEGDWNGNWSDKAHWTSNQEGLGYPATKDSSADFPEGMDGTVTLDGAYTIGKLYFRNPNANITFAPKAGMTAEECAFTVYDFGNGTDYSAHGTKDRTGVNVTFDGVIIQAYRLCNNISADSTWLLKNGAKCYFRSLTIGGANAWFKVTEGSYAYVWGATSLSIWSSGVASELGVLVDDAEFYVCNNMQFNANKNAVSFGKVVIRGKNAKFTNTGMSGRSIYSQSSCVNNHDIVFEIPEGGFANEPVFTVGKQATPAFSVDSSKGYLLGVNFVVDRSSGVYRADRNVTYKLFESLGGYYHDKVTLGELRKRGEWVTDELDPHQAISLKVAPAPGVMLIMR